MIRSTKKKEPVTKSELCKQIGIEETLLNQRITFLKESKEMLELMKKYGVTTIEEVRESIKTFGKLKRDGETRLEKYRKKLKEAR